jgi:hypothetical protein
MLAEHFPQVFPGFLQYLHLLQSVQTLQLAEPLQAAMAMPGSFGLTLLADSVPAKRVIMSRVSSIIWCVLCFMAVV